MNMLHTIVNWHTNMYPSDWCQDRSNWFGFGSLYTPKYSFAMKPVPNQFLLPRHQSDEYINAIPEKIDTATSLLQS